MSELKAVLSNPKSFHEKLTGGNIDEQLQLHTTLEDVMPKYDRHWIFVPHLLKINLVLVLPLMASCLNGFDGAILNGFQAMDSWVSYMGNPTGAVLGALTSGLPFGLLMSIWIAQLVSDKFGRKVAMYCGASIVLAGIAIQSCAVNYASFLVSRIVVGWGLGFYMIAAPALISEIAYPKYRAMAVSFFNTTWYMGSVFAAWVTYGTHFMKGTQFSWRIPAIVQCIFPIIHLSLLYFVPESPRYLVSVGKLQDARSMLLKYHAGDNEEMGGPLVDFQLREIKAAISKEQLGNQTSFSTFFQTKGNFLRFSICAFMGFTQQSIGLNVIAYYLNIVLNSVGITSEDSKLIISACLSISNLVTAFVASLFTGRFGRRRVFLSSLGFLLVTYVIWTILSAINVQRDFADKSLAKGVLAMIFIAFAAYNVGFMGLPYVYLTEILPFSLRSKGLLVDTLSEECFVIFNGFVNPIAMDAIGWKFYIVYCCSIAFCFVVYYVFFPETKDYSLEEVGLVFGDQISFDDPDEDSDSIGEQIEIVHSVKT